MKIQNWKSFNERLSEETLKSAADKAKKYGDKELSDKLMKHSEIDLSKSKFNAEYMDAGDSVADTPIWINETFVDEGFDIFISFDMFIENEMKMVDIPYRFNGVNSGESVDLYLNFEYDAGNDMKFSESPGGLEYKFFNFISNETGDDIKLRYDIKNAKMITNIIKNGIKSELDKFKELPNKDIFSGIMGGNEINDYKSEFCSLLEEIIDSLNYRMIKTEPPIPMAKWK